ncbi:MAG: alpha/beta hydrolase [Chitinophagaceae bacterium]
MGTYVIVSKYLKRKVLFDVYHSHGKKPVKPSMLVLFNDGQDLIHCGLSSLLAELEAAKIIKPMIVVGIHAGRERKQEYGIAGIPDYKGRGLKADTYTSFILEELISFLHQHFHKINDIPKVFAGFSLGGLSALDITWNHPDIFSQAGVFSGSLWWRSKSLEEEYNEDSRRIILQRIRNMPYQSGLKFFFECGTEDEKEDRNQNGIIDAIDDTLDVIDELVKKGYSYPGDIIYHEIPGGKHDVMTWKHALPAFFQFLSKD